MRNFIGAITRYTQRRPLALAFLVVGSVNELVRLASVAVTGTAA